MSWWKAILWFLIKILGLRKWFAGDAEEPTDDDWRNPFWRWTEANRVEVRHSFTVRDFRTGFKRKSDGKWVWWFKRHDEEWIPGKDANFYNGIFTWNQTETFGTTRNGTSVRRTRFNIVIRFIHSYWFAWGVGTLPDRGEFGWTGPWIFSFKSQNEHNPGVIASDHEEGAV